MNDADAVLMQQCRGRVGTQLAGKWTLKQLIGVGGMAAVYEANHRNGAIAAIKMLHPDYAGHPELRARFLREAYIANKVDHVGSVKVLDDDVTESNEPYLVMELLRGASVETYADRNGGVLPLNTVLNLTDQLLAVLEKAHAAGIVHRDIKPDNVFVTEEGVVKVLDFGIARLREGADTKKTATGMLMGTPAFMAPEQALGRWDEVDGRTDLWAVGAIIFTLLSGRIVHMAESANQMLIAAATRTAPSLARVAQAPQPLVEFVDRALSFDPAKRFSDAQAMRQALHEVIATMTGQPSPVAPAIRTQPSTAPDAPTLVQPDSAAIRTGQGSAAGSRATAPGAQQTDPEAEALAVLGRGDDLATAAVADEDVALLRELFVAMERALIAQRQYSKEHPETKKRFERFFSQVASALMNREDTLAWNVTPYSFVAGEHSLWEPAAPFDAIPYQLFSDGVRLLGIVPGLTEPEFMEFLRIITLDRATEMAPEDDFVTLIWDAGFHHIAYQAIDTFAEGGQEERAIFERNVDRVVQLATFDTSEQLKDSWQEHHGERGNAPADLSRRRLVALINSSAQADAESRAQAVRAQMGDVRLDDPVQIQRAFATDPATLQVLATRLETDTVTSGERFVVAAAHAFREARKEGKTKAVASPLRSAVDGLAQVAPQMAIDMIGALARATEDSDHPEESEVIRGELTGAIVSKQTMEHILEGAITADADASVFIDGLKMILKYVDNTHVPEALKVLTAVQDDELKDLLLSYLSRAARGYELELGAKFADAGVEMGLALVRVLAAIDTKEARNAISLASKSPHPVVRIEALGHVEGASSERLRLELRSLLEDDEPEVRVAALRAMRQYGIRVAGPFLVLRIRDDRFDRLTYQEREEALRTVSVLAPTRAEAVGLELLAGTRVMSSEAHEQTRVLACELLGDIARSKEARDALQTASTQRWKSSERVRQAASKALQEIQARADREAAARRASKQNRAAPSAS